MRQAHAGGDKLFVDYAGDTVPVIIDRLTGKTRRAQIFVAVMGASNFTYAEASWTQALGDWIGAHTRAFEAIGGVPNLLVPDNTKVAVIKACLYEPQVNRNRGRDGARIQRHGEIPPARPRRPRDKAKVEKAVLIVVRWLLGRLRYHRFFASLGLTSTITRRLGQFLHQLNEVCPIRRLFGVTRRAPAEEPGSAAPRGDCRASSTFSFAEWRLGRAGVDYHVEVEAHFDSAPMLARSEVEVADAAHRRGLLQGRARRRICCPGNHRHTTVPEHMPSS